MIQYMLDTNICIYIIKQKPQKVFDRFNTLKVGQVCISAITFSEMQFGISHSSLPEKNQKALNKFLAPVEILDYPAEASPIYGELRTKLQASGELIGPHDMLIAAHAMSQNLVLVTNNTKEFSRLAGLKYENWA